MGECVFVEDRERERERERALEDNKLLSVKMKSLKKVFVEKMFYLNSFSGQKCEQFHNFKRKKFPCHLKVRFSKKLHLKW